MANYTDKLNRDGSYTRTYNNGRSYFVPANDSLGRAANAQAGGAGVASGTAANSVSSVSGAGRGTLTSDARDMSFTRNLNGQNYKVEPGDPRYSAVMDEFLGGLGNQQGGQNGSAAIGGGGAVSGGTGGAGSGYNQYANIMNQGRDAYSNALRQQLGLAEDVNARAVAATNQAYDQAASNAYLAYMQQQRQMPQQLAQLGLTGTGMSESAALGAATNYQNNLNANEVSRAKALDDLYLALQQNYADAAEQQAAYENSLYQALADAYLQQYNTDRNYNYQTSRDAIADQRYADETAYAREQAAAQIAREDMLNRIATSLDYYMPTQEAANYFGMTRDQLANYLKRYYGV